MTTILLATVGGSHQPIVTADDLDKGALADLTSGPGFEKIDFGGKAKDVGRTIGQLKGNA